MADARLLRKLAEVTERMRRVRLLRAQAVAAAGTALIAGLIWVLTHRADWTAGTLLAGVVSTLIFGHRFGRSRATDRKAAALLIERSFPELDARLLTALRQDSQLDHRGQTFLEAELLNEVLDQLQRQDWRGLVSAQRLILLNGLRLASLLSVATIALFLMSPAAHDSAPTTVDATDATQNSGLATKVSVEPGNVELERGSSLLVIARFEGTPPSKVDLVATDASGNETRLSLSKSLDDPLFGGRLPAVEQDLRYHVEFDGRRSDEYAVQTFDYPALVRADAVLTYPQYTRLEPRKLDDVRQVTALEKSKLDFTLQLNKPVRSAILVTDKGERIPLTTSTTEPSAMTFQAQPEVPGKQQYKLELVDESGRKNREPPTLTVTVVPNQPPDLKVAFPAKDLQVTSLQELALQASAADDFGLTGMGLVVESSTAERPFSAAQPDTDKPAAQAVTFDRSTAPDERTSADHLLALEDLQLQPDDLVSYYFYADDYGPDGSPRRTVSPIYFAEVRPFEMIYRQGEGGGGEPPSQNQGQNENNPTQKLLNLQREVVSASWNVIRQTVSPESGEFLTQTQVLAESQTAVRSVAAELEPRLEDLIMKQALQQSMQAMEQAATAFHQGHDNVSLEPVQQGRSAAQDAYRALLRLQAREKTVIQAQRQSQSRSQGENESRLDQQLNALQLKNDRNRYETERQAQQEQSAAQQETLEILNRLKELARRQQDLNNRMRELENALRNARNADEQDEIQRQLKRLQEEQQEMLRNVEDLQQQMDQSRNRDQLADARQQVDETRERVMRASEALQEGQTSRALTEGTRAERNLQQLQDQVRQQSAGQFDDNLRQLRQDVRELAQEQQKIAEQLQSSNRPASTERPSLREAPEQGNRGELADQIESQERRLTESLETAKELVKKAETAEPLLSKKLYDTLRDLQRYQPEESLKNAARLTRYGLQPDAQQLEEQAREGIQRLQAGVEDAARGILGDEQAGLEQARTQLGELIESVRRELAMNDPAGVPGNNSQTQPGDPQSRKEQNREGTEQQPSGSGEGPSESQRSESTPSGQSSNDNPNEQRQQERQPGSSRSGEDGASQRPGERPETGEPRSSQPSNQPGEQQSGQREGNTPGQSPGEQGQQPGERGQQPDGQQPGQQRGGQPQSGQQPSSSGEPVPSDSSQQSGQQPGQQPGQQSSGEPSPSESQSPGGQQQQSGGNPRGGSPRNSSNRSSTQQLMDSFRGGPGGGGNSGAETGLNESSPLDPITGESFQIWNDRMRDVEEMLSDPELRNRVAAIRDRARRMRIEVTRHSTAPNWELVRTSIYGPMLELESRIAEELARRNPDEKLVPIDRDPVPEQYSDLVRSYYEQLSRQK